MIITNQGTLSSSYPFGVGKKRGPARDHIAEGAVTADLRRGGWALGAHSSGALIITLDVINAMRYAEAS